MKKLDELAKREQDLAQQQRNGTQTAEQKWQQEMLRREAEQLQQQMEQQLAVNGQTERNRDRANKANRAGKVGNRAGVVRHRHNRRHNRAGQSREQAAQQALDRLRQANDDMKRAESQGANSAASRRAADRLREATDLLGGLEQQDAAGRLGSMAKKADELAARQKQQADHVRDLMAQQNAARTAGRTMKYPTAEEIDKMVDDRQQVSDGLSRLTQQMRDAARELAPTQPGASTKLRSALQGMDENELGTRLQRSSDQLRGGQFSDQAESQLTSDLQKLGQQVTDAARALGNAQNASQDAGLNRAMDDLSRLRDQLSGLGGQQPQTGQRQTGQLARNAGPATNAAGGTGNRQGNVYDNYDTGNTRISGRAVAPQQGSNPADAQRQIEQGLNLLNGVRSAVEDSPEAKRELQALIDQMRNLDPKRFPGNPALVEQMHQQLVSGVDALELQLRRQLEEKQGGTIRNTDPAKIPAGYQDSVAEYYRKLSAGAH